MAISVSGFAGDEVIDGIDGEIHRLKDFERLFLHYIKGALDPLIGQSLGRAIGPPTGKEEKQYRQQKRGDCQCLQQTDGRTARVAVLRKFGGDFVGQSGVGHDL